MTKPTFLILVCLFGLLLAASGLAAVYYGAHYAGHPAREGAVALLLEVDLEEADSEVESPMDRSIQVLKHRLESLDVLDPRVEAYEGFPDRILVEMPAPEDHDRIVELLTDRGELKLTLVEVEGAESREDMLSQLGGILPDDLEIVCQETAIIDSPCITVRREPVITGSDLESASPAEGQFDEPIVLFELTPAAGERFHDLTGAHIGRSLAILYNGEPLSVPRIQGAIGRDGVIHGNFSWEEVLDLVSVLRSGRLPAPVGLVDSLPMEATRWLRPVLIRAGIAAGVVLVCVVAIPSLMLLRSRASGAGGPTSSG